MKLLFFLLRYPGLTVSSEFSRSSRISFPTELASRLSVPVIPGKASFFSSRLEVTFPTWLVLSFSAWLEFPFSLLTLELLIFPVENLVFAELAFQCAIEQRHFLAWFQPDLIEAFFSIREYPSLVSYKCMLQTFANHLVQSEQVIGRDTFAIRRIHHDDGLLLRLFELLERLQFQRHIFGYTRRFYIMRRYFIRFRTVIISVYLMGELALLTIIIVNLIEHLRIEIYPFLECESFAEYSRSDVSCDQCSFYRNRARTAHRVNQVTFTAPSCH